jgi:hypothetical protein
VFKFAKNKYVLFQGAYKFDCDNTLTHLTVSWKGKEIVKALRTILEDAKEDLRYLGEPSSGRYKIVEVTGKGRHIEHPSGVQIDCEPILKGGWILPYDMMFDPSGDEDSKDKNTKDKESEEEAPPDSSVNER